MPKSPEGSQQPVDETVVAAGTPVVPDEPARGAAQRLGHPNQMESAEGEGDPTPEHLFRRRRTAEDFEPLLTFIVMRQLRKREDRAMRAEVDNDRHLRRALAAKVLERMREDGVEVDEAESDTPILDWIRDNWAFIMQAIKDLLGLFTGGLMDQG